MQLDKWSIIRTGHITKYVFRIAKGQLTEMSLEYLHNYLFKYIETEKTYYEVEIMEID